MVIQKQIESILGRHLIPEDRFIYGFADLRGLIDTKFNGFEFAVVFGCRLDDSILDGIKDGPTPGYYTHYRNINDYLADLSASITRELNAIQIETLPVSPTVSTEELDTIYQKTLRTDLSHKMAATRAGLGWIGKTDLLITKKFGPRLRLTTILIKELLISESVPINKSRCGTCNICVDACPADAANGKLWDTDTDRDEFFDARKCRNQCIKFGRERLSENARGCGICVAVCPIGMTEQNQFNL